MSTRLYWFNKKLQFSYLSTEMKYIIIYICHFFYRRLLRSEIGIGVKQRAGCLPYSEDQHGFRTLLAQTLSTAEASSWAVSVTYFIILTLIIY